MALTTNKNTMIFSDRKKRKKLLSPKRKIRLQRRMSQMKNKFTNLAFMAESEDQEASSLTSQGKRRDLWYLDSGCSRHMTGDHLV